MTAGPGEVADPGADRIAHDRALDVALFLEVEYQNRQVVLHAHADRGHVHDLELIAHDLLEAQVRIEHRVRVLFRVGRVDAVHASGLEQDLDAELLAPQRGGCVGRHERASRAAGQDDDPAAAQVRQRPPADERLGDLLHADGGHEPGLAAHALKRVLKSQAVDHRGRHAHVVGGGLLDDVGAPAQLGAAEDVAATDDDGELDPARRHSGSLPGDPADLLDTDTPLAGPAEALAGELEQDSAKRRGAVVDVAVHQEFLTQQEAGCLRAREAPADRAVDGTNEWQMANDRWQMTDGRWQMPNVGWQVVKLRRRARFSAFFICHSPFAIRHSPLLSAIRGQASLERGSQRPSPTTNRANRATEMFSPVRELTARITSRTDFVSSLTNF